MGDDDSRVLSNVIQIDDERIRGHLDRIVRGTVEETLNALLDAEAERLVGAGRYERSEERRDYRQLHTKAGEEAQGAQAPAPDAGDGLSMAPTSEMVTIR